jgi:hypothetical protein
LEGWVYGRVVVSGAVGDLGGESCHGAGRGLSAMILV